MILTDNLVFSPSNIPFTIKCFNCLGFLIFPEEGDHTWHKRKGGTLLSKSSFHTQELSVLPHLQTQHMVTHGVLSPFWLVSIMVTARTPCTPNFSVGLPSLYPQGFVMVVPENQSSQASFGCDPQGRKQIVSFPQDEIEELLLPEMFTVWQRLHHVALGSFPSGTMA